MRTTERWKNEPRSCPLSSSNWPLSDWNSPVITTLFSRTCPRLAPLIMGITLRHDDPNFADRFAARDLDARHRLQVQQRQPRIHSWARLGPDQVKPARGRSDFPLRRSATAAMRCGSWEERARSGECFEQARIVD